MAFFFDMHSFSSFVGLVSASHTARCITTHTSTPYHLFEHRLVFRSFKMNTTAAAVSPLNITPVQIVEARTPPPVRRASTRAAYQNLPYTFPRIPRPAIRQGNTPKANFDSQFQVNASHVQKPFSLVSVSFLSRTTNPLIDNVSERKPGTEDFSIRLTAQYSARGREVGTPTFPVVQYFPHTRRFEKAVGYEAVVWS